MSYFVSKHQFSIPTHPFCTYKLVCTKKIHYNRREDKIIYLNHKIDIWRKIPKILIYPLSRKPLGPVWFLTFWDNFWLKHLIISFYFKIQTWNGGLSKKVIFSYSMKHPIWIEGRRKLIHVNAWDEIHHKPTCYFFVTIEQLFCCFWILRAYFIEMSLESFET